MRTGLITLLVAVAALAGCAGDAGTDTEDGSKIPDVHDDTQSDVAQNDDPGQDETEEDPGPEPEPNRAPVANLTAGKAEAGRAVTVNLTGDDPDGDDLSWTLDLDGATVAEGTSLPATYNHTFADVREAVFILNVTDGEEVATVTLTVTVLEPAPVEVFAGATTITAGPTHEQVGALDCISFLAGDSGIDCLVFELPADYAGLAFKTTSSGPNTYVAIWDSCDPDGEQLSSAHRSEGTIDDGAGCVIMFANGFAPDGAAMTFEVD